LRPDPFGLVGTTIAGRYAVEALVAEGGFSVVYRARHTLWNRFVAIKAIRGFEELPSESREKVLRAFVLEGAILAELSERTTAIVQARDAATLYTPAGHWVPYLVLEWLEGETLEAVLWEERNLDVPPRTLAEAVALLDPVAKALALAHAKGICHRDLKPGNVVLLGAPRGPSCTPKLLDFGVAGFFSDLRWTLDDGRPDLLPYDLSGTLAQRRGAMHACGFTPSYAAPEQFSEAYGITGPWTDVFALALLIVELVAGREPMGEGTTEELGRAAVDPRRRPTPRALGAKVSDPVEAVLARALSVYPAERWQTAGTFWGALREAMKESTGRILPAAPSAAPPRERRAGTATATAAALALALSLAALASSDHGVARVHTAPSLETTTAVR
jgi:serine/threonine protein kinase